MARLAPIHSTPSSKQRPIPPLANGDHLTGAEFERRYDATPGLKKAELIEGRVYVPPPVSHEDHGKPHSRLMTLICTYIAATPGTDGGDNSSVRLDPGNMPQPDAYLFLDSRVGGQTKTEDGYIVGAPELITEIAASSASYDLHEKLQVYRRSGVREYIIWRTLDGAIDYFVLQNEQFVRHVPDSNDVFHSLAFPGLWLDVAALLKDDFALALRRVQEGLASSEHADFVSSLESRRAKHSSS